MTSGSQIWNDIFGKKNNLVKMKTDPFFILLETKVKFLAETMHTIKI